MSAQSTRDSSESSHGSHSPTAPPYSPITPDPSFATLAHDSRHETPQDLSAIESVSESENTDMIALRSTITILQQQRDQSIRDIKTLERQKKEALADPQAFAQRIVAGQLRTATSDGILDQLGDEQVFSSLVDGRKGSSKGATKSNDSRECEYVPGPQNVLRVPPIEWAKYHVVGGALDKLHAEQRKYPASGGPQKDGICTRGPENVVAAPYRPLGDGPLESSKRLKSNDWLDELTENS